LATEIIRDFEVGAIEGMARLRDRLMCGPALVYAKDVLAEIRRRRPDLVVSSDLLHGPMIGAQAAGVPFAVLAANLYIYSLPGAPPFGPGFLPARDESERLRDAEVAALGREMFNQGLPAVNAARQALGLEPLADITELVDTAERYWLATSPAFDFPAERLPENLRYVGPELDDPALTPAWASPWSPEDARPLVLVGFSTTYQAQGGALQSVVDALGTLPVRGLVTLGPGLEDYMLNPPANVVVARSAPHSAVMREANLVVTHAGHGTVMKALAAGLPLLCLPMGRDQPDNAARVVARGAGLALSPVATSVEVAEAVARLLAEPAFRQAAERLGEAIRRDAEQSSLIQELEQLADNACQIGQQQAA
jgi:MGT family glycosyltransferase